MWGRRGRYGKSHIGRVLEHLIAIWAKIGFMAVTLCPLDPLFARHAVKFVSLERMPEWVFRSKEQLAQAPGHQNEDDIVGPSDGNHEDDYGWQDDEPP